MRVAGKCANLLLAKQVLIFGRLSEWAGERSLIASASNIWMLPFFIGLLVIKPSASPWVRYTMLTGIAGIPYTHSILVGMTSRNARSVGARAVSCAVYNMTYQVGSLVAVNIYREEDKPYCEFESGERPLRYCLQRAIQY